ncbi:Transcriptional elongation regulator MINIYO-like protein [Drosera capensis]
MKASPNDCLDNGKSLGIRKPLSQFVSEIGYQIIKNGFLCFTYGSIEKCSTEANGVGAFVDKLCYLRSLSNHVTALTSVCCLHEVFQLLVSIDLSTQLSSECVDQHFSSRSLDSSVEGRIIKDGVIKCSLPPWKAVLQCMKLVVTEWHHIQSIEVFGPGGPAPGVGLGWRASGGVCLIAGPGDAGVVKKAFDFLLQIRVLKYLNVSIRQFIHDSPGFNQLNLEYGVEDLLQFSELLTSHYSKRWLCVKQRKPKETGNGTPGRKTFQESSGSLGTILEDMDVDLAAVARDAPASLAAEWAHQLLPLSKNWLLSPLTTLAQSKDGSSASTFRKPLAAHDSGAMWNALSNSLVLELLPPLDKCVGDAVGYLEPAEEEDDILQAYAKSWASGALDKAVTRGSMSYTLALHNLSSFVFKVFSEERHPE